MYSWIAHWVFILWAALLVGWSIGTMISVRSLQRQRSESRFPHIAIQVMGLWMLFGSSRLMHGTFMADDLLPGQADVALFGLSFTVVGMWFGLWARVMLHRMWGETGAVGHQHALLCTGPYRLMRHPVYAGVIVAAVGTAIIFRRVECFLGVLLIAAGFWFKLRIEEQLMLQQFGEEYARYRSTVRALIPFLL